MADVIKFLGNEENVTNTAASNVDGATLVRLVNISTDTAAVITVQNSDASANLASFTLNFSGTDQSAVFIKKEASEKILASANGLVKAVKVAYF